MLYVGVEANIDSVRDGAKRYEEKNGVHINIDSYPQTQWRERMFTEIAAKSSHYDIWIIDVPEGALCRQPFRKLAIAVPGSRATAYSKLAQIWCHLSIPRRGLRRRSFTRISWTNTRWYPRRKCCNFAGVL